MHSSRFLGDDWSDEQPSLFTTELELTWADTVHRETLRWRSSAPVSIVGPLGNSSIRYWPNSEHLEYEIEPGEGYWALFWEDSVLHDLCLTANRLDQSVPFWSQGQATWFLLTEHVPLVLPLQVEHAVTTTSDYVHARVRVEAQAWVSPKTVEKAYRQAPKSLIGKEYQHLSRKSLAVFRHVVQQRRANEDPSWRALLQSWNNREPRWRYKDVRHFHQAYSRAKDAVVRLISPTVSGRFAQDRDMARKTSGTFSGSVQVWPDLSPFTGSTVQTNPDGTEVQ